MSDRKVETDLEHIAVALDVAEHTTKLALTLLLETKTKSQCAELQTFIYRFQGQLSAAFGLISDAREASLMIAQHEQSCSHGLDEHSEVAH